MIDQELGYAIHQRLGHIRGSSLSETGAPALSRVTVQCELGDKQNLAAHIQDGAIEFARLVLKDAQMGDFVSHPPRFFFSITPADGKQDNQTGHNRSERLAVNAHLCLSYPLHNRFHSIVPELCVVT